MPYICSHNSCEATTLDTPLSNGDIVCFGARSAAAALGDETSEAMTAVDDKGDGEGHVDARDAAHTGASAAEVASSSGVGGDVAGRVTPTDARPRRRTASRSPAAVDLVDGCLLEDMRWMACEHCLPLPGDALVCTVQNTPRSGTLGIVHRADGPGSHHSRCKQLRKQLATGSQLVNSGEDMCELVESTAFAHQQHGEQGEGEQQQQEEAAERSAPSDSLSSPEESLPDAAVGPAAAVEPAAADSAAAAAIGLKTSLVVLLRDEPGALLAATTAVTRTSLAIMDVASRIKSADASHPVATGAFQFTMRVSNLAQLHATTAALESLPQVISVQRDTLEMMLEDSTNAFWRSSYVGAA